MCLPVAFTHGLSCSSINAVTAMTLIQQDKNLTTLLPFVIYNLGKKYGGGEGGGVPHGRSSKDPSEGPRGGPGAQGAGGGVRGSLQGGSRSPGRQEGLASCRELGTWPRGNVVGIKDNPGSVFFILLSAV